LVYSPGPGLIDSALAIVDAETELILLAPAKAHTMGLNAWNRAFVNSRVVCAEIAQQRVKQKTQLQHLEGLHSVTLMLPPQICLHEVPGSNLGEVWLSVQSAQVTYWLVCDSFLNLPELEGKLIARFLMKLYGLKIGLCTHSVFKRGLQDKKRFHDWTIQRLGKDSPIVLIPCHGEVDKQPDLNKRIVEIIKDNY